MLERIIWHWTAGSYTFSDVDKEHYHYSIDGNGTIHEGQYPPEANLSTSDDDGYAAHTSQFNTGSIGVSICAMLNAVQNPFDAGDYPIKQIQLETLYKVTAKLCEKYDIEVSRETVLNHGEVEKTCGVPQSGKWDISWLPGMQAAGNCIEVGDEMRESVLAYMEGSYVPVAHPSTDFIDAVARARLDAIEAWIASFRAS